MPEPIKSIQIQIDSHMEKLLVETTIDYFKSAEDARNKKDYGVDSQSIAFTFDSKLKHLKDMYYGRRQPKTVPWKNCFSKDTEILTKNGWKLIKDVKVGEYVLSLNPKTFISSYQKVTALQSHSAEKLISFKNKAIDLLVTHNHSMLIRKFTKYHFIPAEKFLNNPNNNYIPLTSKWQGKYIDKIYGFDSEDFMEFLGWYVSEGFTYKSGTISICQSDKANKEKCLEIENLLQRMELKYSYSTNKQYLISCKHSQRYAHKKHICNQIPQKLRNELKSLGKCTEKYIPRRYLDLSSDLLSILLESLTKGDGYKKIRLDRVPMWSYTTTSKLLADNIQEITQKIGLKATISIRDDIGKYFIASNPGITRNLLYIVTIGFKKYIKTNRIEIKEIDYKDFVYCVTTEPYHTIFVRRNGKAIWCGNCSNRSMKIAMAIIEMLHSRIFPAVWNENLVRWKPGEKTDREKTERINKFMFWWVNVKAKMHSFYDKWVKSAIGFGDVFTEVSWDVKVKDTGEFIITPIVDEFGIQVYEKDGKPAEKKDKKLKLEENTRTEIIPRENVYFQEGQKDIQEEPVIIKVRWLFSDLETMERDNKAVNIREPLHDDSQYLEKQLEGFINETVSGYNENIEIIKEVKLRVTPIDVLKCYIKMDIDADGIAEDIRLLVDPLRKVYLGGVLIKDISKRVVRPINITKVNDLLEDPDCLDGYGFLEMVMPLSEEIDAIFNQLTDANTLSVLRPGFYDPSGNLQPQNITLAPNKMIPVPNPQQNIYFPNIEIPTERLLVAMRGVLEFIERLTAASSYIMGKESEIVGGSGTATRTQAIVSAADTRFAIPAIRLKRGAAQILTLVFDQIQKNIPMGLENRVLGEDGEPIFKGNELTEEGLSGEYDAYLLEDVSMGSVNVERQLAGFIYATLLQNPIVNTDPIKMYNETAKLLKAYGEEPEEHLGQEPEASTFRTPEEENTLILQGSFNEVRAKLMENHIQHMYIHNQLSASPTMAMLNPAQQQNVMGYIQAHIQEHQMMMQQMMAITQRMRGAGGKTGAGGNNQGNPPAQGVGNLQEPFASVEATKEQGTSGYSPTM